MVTVGKRAILHVDMDAFYAAVEERENPALRGKPVVVGSEPKEGRGRGVVATANYAARRYGIGSAMPISEAWRRCPSAVYLRPRMRLYAEVSREVRAIFERFTDLIEPISIDEAFLDVTASRRLYGDGPAIAVRIKDAIRGEQELTASIGCAASKFVGQDRQRPRQARRPGGRRGRAGKRSSWRPCRSAACGGRVRRRSSGSGASDAVRSATRRVWSATCWCGRSVSRWATGSIG